MRLYHGSKSGLSGVIAPVSRDVCDFGRGFYMGTETTHQALGLGDQYCARTAKACEHVKIASERALSPDECAALRMRSESQRTAAVKMVDRIRLEHRRDGMFFSEIIEKATGRTWL